jgi:hypothetical protein
MVTVKVNVETTQNGFCASIDLLPGCVVSVKGNILKLKKGSSVQHRFLY